MSEKNASVTSMGRNPLVPIIEEDVVKKKRFKSLTIHSFKKTGTPSTVNG